jgi:F0F1-type ATP synthase assembly protein I
MVRYVALVVEIIDAVVAGVKVGGVISRLVDLLPLFIVIG